MDKQYKLVPIELLDRFPEINLSNYGPDDVEALNAWGIEVALSAAPEQPSFTVDDLAQEIRRVDGKHDLGAAALAEKLFAFITSRNPSPAESFTVNPVARLNVTLDGTLETLFRVGEHLGIDYAAARKAPGKPSDIYIAAIQAIRNAALEECAVICDENIDPQEAAFEIRALKSQPARPSDTQPAWTLADKVRADLDRQSCPDAFMRIAVESIVKHFES